MKRWRLLSCTAVALALALVLGTAACGDDGSTASDSSSTTSKPLPLTVFAAASLTESFQGAQPDLPGLDITYSFAGSGALVAQIQNGAPADVIATADLATMRTLSDAGLVGEPVTFARNQLEILVAPGNPHHIDSLDDLEASDLKVVLADDTVPAGKYAKQILDGAGVSVSPVSNEVDVKGAVAKVTSGEADATIVYVTDVTAAGSKGEGVEIPEDQNVTAEYPIAVVKASTHQEAALAFVESAVSGKVHDALEDHGFLAAT
jgi:molybdate transport system substrate-binding protein